MQAPAGDAGDFLTAYGTTSVLVVPEKAKNFRTPKCISHMGLSLAKTSARPQTRPFLDGNGPNTILASTQREYFGEQERCLRVQHTYIFKDGRKIDPN